MIPPALDGAPLSDPSDRAQLVPPPSAYGLEMGPIRMARGVYWGQAVASVARPNLRITLTSYEGGREFPEHCHEFPGLFVLIAGDHEETDGHGSTRQPAFSGIWHEASKSHATRTGPRGMIGINVSLAGFGTEVRPSAKLHSGPDAAYFAARLFAALEGDGGPEEVQNRAWELLSIVDGEPSEAPSWLARVHEEVRSRFQEPLRLNELAAESGVHPVYLARCYRYRYGRSVTEHRHELRLGQALRLMGQGLTLGEAAHQAGFSDQAHFCRDVRRRLRCRPSYLHQLDPKSFICSMR